MPRIVEKGSGAPLVFIPGIQGRWEFQRDTVDALAESFRVITFSLSGEQDEVIQAMDAAGVRRAVVCGVSYGALLALRFAARHADRTSGLVMVSAPGPNWHLRRRHEIYARLPWVFGPLFLAETPFRLAPELRAAIPRRRDRWRFRASQLQTLLTAPVRLDLMAARAREIQTLDRAGDCRRVASPTLVVCGDAALDHVVKAGGTAEYARLIAGARLEVLRRTGHLGSVTRAREFADLVRAFVTARVENHDAA